MPQEIKYETIELLISKRQQDGYPITIQSQAGEANAVCHLDPVNDEIQEMLERISNNDTDDEFLKEF